MTRRSPALDLVRAVCILGVVATHYIGNFVHHNGWKVHLIDVSALGSFGVTGFFLLSSYLLTNILVAEVARGRTGIWKRYLTRRALRIWPLYFAVVLVGAAVATIAASGLPSTWFLTTFTYNWVSWSRPTASWLGHFWSVCAEEQLYLVIPTLCFVAFRVRWKVLLVLVAIGPLARLYTVHHYAYPAVWNFTTSHLDTFALGMLLASLDAQRAEGWVALRRRLGTAPWAAAVAAGALAALVARAWVAPDRVYSGIESVVTYPAATLVFTWLLLAATERGIGATGRPHSWLQWVGRRSYGIYVFHWPLVVFGTWAVRRWTLPSAATAIVLVGASLLAAEISFRWFERPFLRLKERFSAEAVQIPSAA